MIEDVHCGYGVARGEVAMMVVTSNSSGTRVELWCCLCRCRLGLNQAWMCFPADCEGHEGRWVHEACVRGEIRRLFGESRAVMMRGAAALSHLAASLNFSDE